MQIKEIDKYVHDKIQEQELGFTGHFRENPIAIDPVKYSYTVIQSKLEEVLKSRTLNHIGSEFLAKEFIFTFIDKFHIQLGLEDKDKYTINELLYSYNVYMPIWIKESLTYMLSINRNNIKERVYMSAIDPDSMLNEIMLDEREDISIRIKSRIDKGEFETSKYIIQHNKLPFRTFIEFLQYLQALDVKTISRVYRKRDFKRSTKLNSNYLFNVFSKEDIKYNLQVFLV